MTLIQNLANGPLDIVGDIHGEIDALENLVQVLGYQPDGSHPKGRSLVFIGDFCDRGPNSVAVIRLVEHWVGTGMAQAILGNHEINLLINDAKDGSGWFFDSRYESDTPYYAPFARASEAGKPAIRRFFNSLPLALERDDLRIVHAAWHPESIDAIRGLPVGKLDELHAQFDGQVLRHAKETGVWDRYQAELSKWKRELESESNPPPFLHAVADYDALQRAYNPIKVITSGVEEKTQQAFFSGNRWRFSDRVPWWNYYEDQQAVIIGHYWRLFRPRPEQIIPRYSQLFSGVDSLAWHGKNDKVFCVDYSVGARWRERRARRDVHSRFHLAALQWPEGNLVFDTGERFKTQTG